MKQFFVFITALMLLACENSESEINAFGKKAVQKDEAIKVESYLSQGGKLKAKLTTPLMLRVAADTPYVEFPKTLHVDFFNEQKIIESKLDAKYGKYFESLNKVYLRDSVKVVSIKGDTLTCEDLWWDQEKELFYTDRPATLKSPTAYPIYGKDGLKATQDFKSITFNQVQQSQIISEGDAIPGNSNQTAPKDSVAAN
ncbi:LPS export ABC transporter periplasmic protein LptC [Niabella ginsengisoli]|uniref:LPS export ABC transporter periplasmic protein LptC n=1 Tax=Niabella ginsengisoli TaxID=522298 RepID=A0ABS9SMW3_9BACT|nr:LPS export ABC transporter periplasmic protein LptC [Niabella ginsengisoli]MCH5599694.1 LPS export ABC transporter periplasmic protein LptC [Niabella ginsengisoli]